MTNDVESFPGRLRKALVLNGLSQENLAVRMRKDTAQVNRWARGVNLPRPRTIRQIADALGIRMAWLAFGEGEMEAPQNSNEPVGAGSSSTTAR